MSTENRENSVGAAPLTDDCGGPLDEVWLWKQVQRCVKEKPGPCEEVDSGYAVMRGKSGSKVHYLLVPTERIKGIECPTIWKPGATDYWLAAANRVPTYFHGQGMTVGLGINSKYRRDEEQLHIHMVAFATNAAQDLKEKDKSIPTSASQWKSAIFPVRGHASSDTRNYRVLRVDNFADNPFSLLRNHVLTADSQMQYQMMVMIPRAKGYYILNSESSLSGGTDSIDHLLKTGT
ncbi:CDP-diacylglycerol diphosphatase [Streptomyces sp. NPDC056835]|uniref:CDP-diacylglycerol diphosphatase n=1 Tax=Streptomyces sp. NPDC056835 TaxID=3345956 RepID=UPI0036AE09B5